jgi:putative transposase
LLHRACNNRQELDKVITAVEGHYPTFSPAKLAHQIKGYTSRTLRQEFSHLRSRMPTMWSRSYFISSVGAVSEATIKRYIEEQETR